MLSSWGFMKIHEKSEKWWAKGWGKSSYFSTLEICLMNSASLSPYSHIQWWGGGETCPLSLWVSAPIWLIPRQAASRALALLAHGSPLLPHMSPLNNLPAMQPCWWAHPNRDFSPGDGHMVYREEADGWTMALLTESYRVNKKGAYKKEEEQLFTLANMDKSNFKLKQ